MVDLKVHMQDCRVSSVLNRDVKMYGKKFLFDESEETCWSSDQGMPQWVEVAFKEACEVSSVSIQFQGGFVGKDCHFNIECDNGSVKTVPFFPEDVNSFQTFQTGPVQIKKIRIVFLNSTDFFGRIVIYGLKFS